MYDENALKHHANQIRKHILEMVFAAKSGHIGGSLSACEILTALYFTQMDICKANINSTQRDRFVLSKGHASPLLYAILSAKGLLGEENLLHFRKLNSNLQGHPNMRSLAGVDMSTGSLGQGISNAVGMALSNQYHELPYRIYALLGDGECEEGQVWEAAMSAAHYHLDNLVAIIDHNGLQIDGAVNEVMNPTPIDEKFSAFGWHVINVSDGHDFKSIINAFQQARSNKGKPTAIIAHTIKGKGVSFMENVAGWHGVAPDETQFNAALAELEKGDQNG